MTDPIIKTSLSPNEAESIRYLYRDALTENTPGAEARMEILEILFGDRMFLDLQAEHNPCPHRVRTPDGFYLCKLAQAEMERLGKRIGYDTTCRWLTSDCYDPLNPKNQ